MLWRKRKVEPRGGLEVPRAVLVWCSKFEIWWSEWTSRVIQFK